MDQTGRRGPTDGESAGHGRGWWVGPAYDDAPWCVNDRNEITLCWPWPAFSGLGAVVAEPPITSLEWWQKPVIEALPSVPRWGVLVGLASWLWYRSNYKGLPTDMRHALKEFPAEKKANRRRYSKWVEFSHAGVRYRVRKWLPGGTPFLDMWWLSDPRPHWGPLEGGMYFDELGDAKRAALASAGQGPRRNAKLSARGRHEVARFEQEAGDTHEGHPLIYIVALMSDGKVLKAHKAYSEYDSKMVRSTWRVSGTKKASISDAEWIAHREAAGWVRVKTRV